MQNADAHLLTGISDESKYSVTFFHYESTRLCLPYSILCYTLQLFGPLVTNLLFACPLKYCLPFKYILQIKTHPVYCSIL